MASSVEHTISGGYQLDALLHGWRFQRAWHRARLDLVARVLPPAANTLSLDAAAGSGIVQWRFPDAPIVSADMRVSACRSVRAHSPAARTAAADVSTLPFRSGSFAQLFFLEAIEHLDAATAVQALQELRRVARPGALCLVTTPNYRSYWVALEKALDRLNLTPPMEGGQHVTQYDAAGLRRVVERSGWSVRRAGSFNFAAPFLGTVSRRAGAWAVGREASGSIRAGALLFALCEARG